MGTRTRLRLGISGVAILQIVPLLVLPLDTLLGIDLGLWVVIVLFFGLLGYSLWRRKQWSRLATIFVQGFNVIVRLLVLIGHAVEGGQPGNPVDFETLGTFVVSIILSGIILYYIDLPDIQVAMQQES